MHGPTRTRVSVLAASLILAALLGVLGSDALGQATRGVFKAKTLLPDADVTKVVEETAKLMQAGTRSASEFNQKAKLIENEAYNLALVAEAAAGNEGVGQKVGPLRDASLALAAACKKKDYNEAKKQVAIIAGFKTLSGSPKGELAIDKEIPIKNLMAQVRDVDKELKKCRNLSAAGWNAKGKAEEIQLLSNKMVALTVGILGHTPDTDPDAKKGQTKKAWHDTAEETQAACLEVAAAARAKNPAEFKKAYNKMDSACTKCHEIYRVETD